MVAAVLVEKVLVGVKDDEDEDEVFDEDKDEVAGRRKKGVFDIRVSNRGLGVVHVDVNLMI